MKRSILAACLLASTAPLALAQSSGARDLGMGGVGVASSKPFNSIFVNPALLTRASDSLDVGMVLPYVDVAVRDDDELVEGIEDFQDTLEAIQGFLDAGDPVSADALRPTLSAQLAGLDGRAADLIANAGTGFVLPFEGLRLGVGFRTYVDARALPLIDPADIAVINNPGSTSADLDNLQSEAVVVAANVREVGFSLAADVELFGLAVALGVTPKFQQVETFNYAIQVSQFDDDDALDDYDDEIYRDDDDQVNVDVGAAISLTDAVTAGLSLRDLVAADFETVITNGRSFTYQVEPTATAGVALAGAGFSLSADLDLIPTSRFDGLEDSMFARVGAEYDLAGWVQLRAGYSHDLEDVQSDLLHAGIGLSPFQTVRLDLVGLLGDNGGGAGLQLAITL